MVHNCAIISCPLHNRRNIRKGLLFHSFPVDQHRFELWRQTVFNHCSQTLSINKHSKICYRHFHPDDYIANHTGLTRYLKASAVPSIFTETNSNTNRSMKFNTCSDSSSISSPLSIIPSKSSSPTNTKAKRLLNTIDKLHQIQSANNKISITQNFNVDNEQIKEDEEENKSLNEQSPIQLINDNNSSVENSFSTDHSNTPKEAQISENIFSQSSIESDLFHWTENSIIALPKNHLEDALFKFLEQANLLQYYSAFIEQGGDDLKQLAEAQNDDFQEIITLVGMVSKPLHVKRFKKALNDYQQSLNTSHHLPNDDSLSNRNLFSSFLPSTSPKTINSISSNWCLNKNETNKITNTHQLLDDNQRKMIADEAERLANLIPITAIKRLNGRNHISKDLFKVYMFAKATMNLPRDFEDRWQRIRKYSAIYNRFDSKKPQQILSLHEILINEAAAAICFHRPEFLTRRDELLHLARRVLQNIGITTTNLQKRSLSMLTCDVSPNKQMKLNISLPKSHVRQRDPDAFRLMWHNREAKVEQIPVEIETLRCEQNKLLQQLKQNTIDSSSSSSVDNNELKKQIDDLSTKIEQLTDEEKNLRRLIRKKNMRLRAKERQQQKQQMTTHHSPIMHDLMLPIIPILPSPVSLSIDTSQYQQDRSSTETNQKTTVHDTMQIKDEKIEPIVNLSSPVLKPRKECSTTTFLSKTIDKRREEINNEKANNFKTKTILSTVQSSHSIPVKQSSSTIAIKHVSDYNLKPSRISSDIQTILDDDDDNDDEIVESKSFLHSLDFNIHNPIETNE